MTQETQETQETAGPLLLATYDIAKRCEVHADKVKTILAAAGIKPWYSRGSGRGGVTIFNADIAIPIVRQAVEAEKRAKEEPPALAAPVPGGAESRLTQHILDLSDPLLKITAICRNGNEQNASLLRQVGELQRTLVSEFATLKQELANVRASIPAPYRDAPMFYGPSVPALLSNAEAYAEAETRPVSEALVAVQPARKKLRVVVAGLLDAQRAMIQSEFSDTVDLRFYTASEAKGKAFRTATQSCDVVVAMVGFVDHSVGDVVRSSGAKLINCNGGMTKLRDTLTELYVNSGEPVAA